jgi:pimeloyl-ACP methyl ester carboxylesterase
MALAPARFWRRTCRVLRILFLFYVMACIGCAAFQRRMLYSPTNRSVAAYEREGKARGLERWKNSAGQIIGWKRLATEPVRGALIITHGNGGCATDRADFANFFRERAAMDIFILEYPGFGDRAGTPGQQTLFDAAEDGFQSLPKSAPIYVVGESLGTGVAAHLAGTHPQEIAGVLLLAPYNTLIDVAQYHVRILPARWLMVDYFPAAEYLSHYRGPLAIFVGGKDRVVPEKFSGRLFEDYRGPKRLWRMPNAGHNNIHSQSGAYWNEVIAFWREHSVQSP